MTDIKDQDQELISRTHTQELQGLSGSLPEDLAFIKETETTQQSEAIDQSPLRFYEIIYGIFFDPVRTMKKVTLNPPIITTVLIVVLLSLISLLTNLYSSNQGVDLGIHNGLPIPQAANISQALRAATPLLAILGAIFFFLKWFFYSALLHLVADFYGGEGKARTAFVVYGLAGLPEVFLVPLGVITTWLSSGITTAVMALANLIILIWGIILLTIGLREAYEFSTGRALAVIFTPAVVAIVLAIIGMVGFMGVLSSFGPMIW
ncbi:hypothetical protein JCM14036_06160 [Desulfotomaculum defluvii]